MAAFTWVIGTPIHPTNLNKLIQVGHITPTASTWNSTTGRVLTHNLGHTYYMVVINTTANPGGNLGEVWYDKAANTVTVYNSGSFTGAFEYAVIPGV